MKFRGAGGLLVSYDVQLGRWMQPDPMMQHASPYLAMGNNPTVYTDPLGLEDGWDDYIGYDQDGTEVARSKREGKDRYFSLIRSGEGTWELVGELDEAPRLKRGGGNGDFYREPIDNLKASFYLPMSAAIMAHNAKLDAEEARRAAIQYDLERQAKGCGECLNTSTLGHNLLGLSYPGGNNPKTKNKKYSYSYIPINKSEFPAIGHDRRYDRLNIAGASGLLTDRRAIGVDIRFVLEEMMIANNITANPIDRIDAGILGLGLGLAALPKTILQVNLPLGYLEVIGWYNYSNIGVTNTPSVHKH